MGYIYLASPYSHPDPEVREARYTEVLAATAALLNQRLWVYSPIVHCHDLSIQHKLPFDFEFWKGYNRAMIESCSTFAWLWADGWATSKGLNAERQFAHDLGKTIAVCMTSEGEVGLFEEVFLKVVVE